MTTTKNSEYNIKQIDIENLPGIGRISIQAKKQDEKPKKK
jgi:hypothetical protein